MLSLRSVAALVAALALTLLVAAGARADAGSSPAGQSAVGAYLDLGGAHGCALQRDRTVRCWGKGSAGRLGGGLADRLNAPTAADASSLAYADAAAVTAGDAHTCVLATAGAVRCWGQGSSGQLGSGTRDNRGDGTADPLSGTDDASTVPLGAPAIAVSAGGEFTCALLNTGAVRCWGDGRFGTLGSGGTDGRLDGLPDGPTDDASIVPLGAPATAISAGTQHACALLVGGTVRCWGSGAEGRLGSGATDDRLDGVATGGTDDASTVPLTGPATAISAGGAHTCALLASGAVSCWGSAGYGQLGAGRTDARLDGVVSGAGAAATDAASIVPIKPVNTPQNRLATTASISAIAIAAGDQHTCAVVDGGDVRCWGRGTAGQLGQSAVDHRLDQSVTTLADVATRVGGGPNGQVAAGLGSPAIGLTAGYGATCAELATGTVRCWGDGTDGRLGTRATDGRLDGVIDPATNSDDASFVPIAPLPSVNGDLLTEQGAGPAPGGTTGGTPSPAQPTSTPTQSAPVANPLSFKFTVKGRKATVAALLEPTKAGTCPKSVSAIVTEGKTRLGTAKLKATKKGAHCRASGTVKLKRSAKKGKTLKLALRAKGVRSRSLQPTR